jgi:lysine 6-dehydrogenase
VLDGRLARKGVCPPEHIGADEESFRFVMEYLRKRNVHYRVAG